MPADPPPLVAGALRRSPPPPGRHYPSGGRCSPPQPLVRCRVYMHMQNRSSEAVASSRIGRPQRHASSHRCFPVKIHQPSRGRARLTLPADTADRNAARLHIGALRADCIFCVTLQTMHATHGVGQRLRCATRERPVGEAREDAGCATDVVIGQRRACTALS